MTTVLTTALALLILALGLSAVVAGAGAYGARNSRPGTPHPDRQPGPQHTSH